NRIFAISSVSGSSVAAVTISAALSRASPTGAAPCKHSDELYYREGKPSGWRECLEVILSGDFLSAPPGGTAFRDIVPLISRRGRDRAGMIEDAWVGRFNSILDINEPPDSPSLDDPFSSFRPIPGRWLPLLLINGTSVETGRRILTTHLS